jgi:NADPH-dependent ferric siderophore reductase
MLSLSRKDQIGPRLIRVTLAGDELDGFEIEQPAASVRLLFPSPGSSELLLPEWNGNEFLLADGSRPIIRTFTPRAMTSHGLAVEMVIHEGGAASGWAQAASPGDRVALSGPGRGYTIDEHATRYLLIGDETAIPAISQLLEHIPVAVPVEVHLEVASDFGRLDLPTPSRVDVTWHELAAAEHRGAAMLVALRDSALTDTTSLWCAGEAAAMYGIRNYLFGEAGLARSRATVRGYWKARD